MEDLTKDQLVERVRALELENDALRASLSICGKNPEVKRTFAGGASAGDNGDGDGDSDEMSLRIHGFTLDEYKRYGRQMIVPEFGSLKAQTKLKNSSVLVIGAGGLGCPVLLYLGAAGVGKIGIIDGDVVDTSNLHRQVLHTTESVGMYKCDSAKRYISRLNPHVEVSTFAYRLTNYNAFDIIGQYDVVVDCTDTPSIRYLINDVSVLCGKTVVSGAGLKSDGQFSVLNFQQVGPCYRCFYPTPPAPGSVTSCSDGGVIGPVIGLIGVSMAIETIKVITEFYTTKNFRPSLSVFSGYPAQQLRMFKMRNKQLNCCVCGDSPSISRATISNNELDYTSFCGKVDFDVLEPKHQVTAREYHDIVSNGHKDTILIDVRPKEQFEITHLDNSINIEWNPTLIKLNNIDAFLPSLVNKETTEVFVVCRYGNDSQLATRKLFQELGFKKVKEIKGGLYKWSTDMDSGIPQY